jgi:hypothetical protein
MEHWASVEALAQELIAHWRIEGERIAEIIDHAMRTADAWRARADRAGDQPVIGAGPRNCARFSR